MQLQMYCAYNQTRECFLGLEVTAGDFSYKALSRPGALTIKASEGLWLAPYRGIPNSGITAPLDLVFLDQDCRVVDLIESFPALPLGQEQNADSVLVLPAHSIFSSVTQRGDQIVLCIAEEMQRRLERLSGSDTNQLSTQTTAAVMTKSVENRTSTVQLLADQPEQDNHQSAPAFGNARVSNAKGFFRSPKNWLQRLWSSPSDKRQAARQPAPGVTAYYWNGHGILPTGHPLRDISASGLFLLTEDRWYPGTLIMMTLQDKNGANKDSDDVISVNVRVVRTAADGVGLQFVAACSKDSDKDGPLCGDKNKIEGFLNRIENLT